MYAKINPFRRLPSSEKLSNGQWVSNYHLLPDDILRAEGWLPLVENKPEYNPETQYLEQESVVLRKGKVVVNYKAVEMPVYENLELVLIERDTLKAEKKAFIESYSPTMSKAALEELIGGYTKKRAEPIELPQKKVSL